MTVITCPSTLAGIEAAQALLSQMINYGSEMVLAQGSGIAKLTVNACPGLEAVPAAPMGRKF
jgi:hypothetical protein